MVFNSRRSKLPNNLAVEQRGDAVFLRLSRPAKCNAIDPEMLSGFVQFFGAARGSPNRDHSRRGRSFLRGCRLRLRIVSAEARSLMPAWRRARCFEAEVLRVWQNPERAAGKQSSKPIRSPI